jgi:hypothetical protein
MKKLNDALDNVDVKSVWQVNKLLRNLHSDALYFKRIGRLQEVDRLAQVLANFVSINQTGLYHNLGKQRYIKGLESIIQLCKTLR